MATKDEMLLQYKDIYPKVIESLNSGSYNEWLNIEGPNGTTKHLIDTCSNCSDSFIIGLYFTLDGKTLHGPYIELVDNIWFDYKIYYNGQLLISINYDLMNPDKIKMNDIIYNNLYSKL